MKKLAKILCVSLTMSMLLVVVCVIALADEGPVAIVYRGGNASDSYEVTDIYEAFDKTKNGDVVYLLQNAEIDDYVILNPGVTFIIPTSDKRDDTVTGSNNVNAAPVPGKPYATLTLLEGANIDVYGDLLVAANQQCTSPNAGQITGDYGAMVLEAGSSITVEKGANFYARGIVSGSGTITAMEGANIYQLLRISDYRGGTVTRDIYKTRFPLNCYDINNIECPITYNYGSQLLAQYFFAAKVPVFDFDVTSVGHATIIGVGENTKAVFSMTNSETSMVKINGTRVDLYGDIVNGEFAVTVSSPLGNFDISTSGLMCPVYNMNVTVNSGCNLNITETLKFLPGTSLTVDNGGSVNLNGKTMYFYTADKFQSDFSLGGYHGPMTNALLTVNEGGKFSGTVASTSDTHINITVPNEVVPDGEEIVTEITQVGTTTNTVDVTFYKFQVTVE